MPAETMPVRFIGVYNADGGLVGELRYLARKLSGQGACSLCDITHGLNPRGKPEWRACAEGLPVPVETLHKNEQFPALAELTAGKLPCIAAEFANGSYRIVIDDEALAACNKEVACLERLLLQQLRACTKGTPPSQSEGGPRG